MKKSTEPDRSTYFELGPDNGYGRSFEMPLFTNNIPIKAPVFCGKGTVKKYDKYDVYFNPFSLRKLKNFIFFH